MNFDIATISNHAKTSWETLHPGEKYPVILATASYIQPGITDDDLAGINQIFFKSGSSTERRVKEAHLARLRRIAQVIGVQEESLLIIDVRTRIVEVEALYERLKTVHGEKWKSKSRPWDMLLHYCYRVPRRTNSATISINLEIYRECVGWPASNSYHANTGWRVFLPPGTALDQTVGRVIAHAGKWFGEVCLLTSTETITFNTKGSSPPSPFESEQFDGEIEVPRNKVVQVLRSVRPEIPLEPELRIFTYFTNQKNRSDGEFVPWFEKTSRRTRSGTILVGWATFLFIVDLRVWNAHQVDIHEQRDAKQLTARHYRHQRGIHEA